MRCVNTTVREWIGTLTDILSMHRAEVARDTLAGIIADSNDAVIDKGLDGRITSWNRGAERLFGYTAEQVVGKNIRIIIPPERQQEEDRIIKAIRRGEKVEHYDRSGKPGMVALLMSPSPPLGSEIPLAKSSAPPILPATSLNKKELKKPS